MFTKQLINIPEDILYTQRHLTKNYDKILLLTWSVRAQVHLTFITLVKIPQSSAKVSTQSSLNFPLKVNQSKLLTLFTLYNMTIDNALFSDPFVICSTNRYCAIMS